MPFDVSALPLPIVQAPMAGGPSTPALAAAVSEAGGLGFLAAGYATAAQVEEDLAAVRAVTRGPVGINLFAPPGHAAAPQAVADFAATLAGEAERYDVALGQARFDDDAFDEKLALARDQNAPVVSFTFGCPSAETVASLHERDLAVWVTVTDPDEAGAAETAGADALVAQGTEAGGHRAYFRDDVEHEEYGLLVLLRVLAGRTALPLIATGGIMDGAGVAAVLVAGAAAAQLGSAFLLTPEAGTVPVQRERLAAPGATRLTRAFSGRAARGIVNRFMIEHDADAPRAYPEVHHVTSPVRAAARARGDADAINLWAGQGHALAVEEPAGALTQRLAAEARARLTEVAARLTDSR